MLLLWDENLKGLQLSYRFDALMLKPNQSRYPWYGASNGAI